MTVFENEPLAVVVVVPTVCSDRFRPGRAWIVTTSPAEAPATVPDSVAERPYITTLAELCSVTCTDEAARTAAVWCEIDEPEPDEFVAVTTTRSVLPTSSEVGVYVWSAAPRIS